MPLPSVNILAVLVSGAVIFALGDNLVSFVIVGAILGGWR